MRIAIIGTTQYLDRMKAYGNELRLEGHEVRLPALDDHIEWNELQICEYNRSIIEWANKIVLFWDGRSVGAIFDLGMVFALKKPLVIAYLERKDFRNVVRLYAEKSEENS